MAGQSIVDEQEQTLIYEDATTTPEYIACAFNAINAVSELDTEIMNESDKQRIKRIRRKSIRIIDYCLGVLYDELFDDENED